MNDSGGLEKLQKWMERNKVGLIPRQGNRGNRVTTYLYNIINNNNINIIDSTSPTQEAVTLGQMQEVTGVTENSALPASGLPWLPKEKARGNQNNQTISARLPRLPELPASGGDGGVGSEKFFSQSFWPGWIRRLPNGPRAPKILCFRCRYGFRPRDIWNRLIRSWPL